MKLIDADTINRQDAIYAMVNAIWHYPNPSFLNSHTSAHELVEYALKRLPSAEPEIIRCRDCKHYDGRPCGIVDYYNTEDDFCSRAERSTEDMPSAKIENDIDEWKAWFCIGETLVDVSKMHMTADDGIRKIRDIMQKFEPGRRPGHWRHYDSDNPKYDSIKCSVCGHDYVVDAEKFCDIGFTVNDLQYCPNCGAKMKRENG